MVENDCASPGGHWARMSEAGSYTGMQILFWVHRNFGRGVFRVFLFPAMIYFFLRRGEARRASREYLQRLHKSTPGLFARTPGYWMSFRHFLQFGESALDKVVAWSDQLALNSIDVVDQSAHTSVMADPRGRLIIGSHLGNLEYCRGFATQHHHIVINALVYDGHAVNFTRMLERANPDSRINVIQVTQLDVTTILLLKQKIAAGEWLVIAGDRIPVSGDTHTTTVNFLGAPARFPIGPYVLASTLQCPVTLLFAYRVGKRLAAKFETFAEKIELPRGQRQQQLHEYTQLFADRLADNCRQAPLQWFNFFSFWQATSPIEPSVAPTREQ